LPFAAYDSKANQKVKIAYSQDRWLAIVAVAALDDDFEGSEQLTDLGEQRKKAVDEAARAEVSSPQYLTLGCWDIGRNQRDTNRQGRQGPARQIVCATSLPLVD